MYIVLRVDSILKSFSSLWKVSVQHRGGGPALGTELSALLAVCGQGKAPERISPSEDLKGLKTRSKWREWREWRDLTHLNSRKSLHLHLFLLIKYSICYDIDVNCHSQWHLLFFSSFLLKPWDLCHGAGLRRAEARTDFGPGRDGLRGTPEPHGGKGNQWTWRDFV